jgi:hypothetical protein
VGSAYDITPQDAMTRPDYYRRLLADRTKTEALLTDAIARFDEYVTEQGIDVDTAHRLAVTDTLDAMAETIDLHEYLDQHPEAIP